MAKEKSSNKSFVLRIDEKTMEAIEKWAADEFRSVNGQIQWILSEALKKVWDKGWKPVNVDCTIIAQKPKLAPFMNQINSSLAAILQLPVDCVNVKAKTNEKLGFEGKEEGIVAQAVILLEARA